MQIELIAPASEDSTYLPRMGLGILAAQTPPDIEVTYTDETLRPLDIATDLKDVDLRIGRMTHVFHREDREFKRL